MTELVVATSLLVAALAASGGARRRARTLVPHTTRSRRRHHRVEATAALVSLVETTARDVRAGASLRSALIDAIGPRPHLLGHVGARLHDGSPLSEALAPDDLGSVSDDAAFVLHGLRLAASTGGATADTLERVAAIVRERHAFRGERFAHAAQARLSARVLTVLPLVVGAWGYLSSAQVRRSYSVSPITPALAVTGVLLNLIGWWWMRRLVAGGRSA
jgi:tight adherence protein B